MSNDDQHAQRALELEQKLLRDDGAEEGKTTLSAFQDAIKAVTDAISGMNKRMDAIEQKAKPPHRRLGPSAEDDGGDDLMFDELPPGEQDRLVSDEVDREPGKALALAADS